MMIFTINVVKWAVITSLFPMKKVTIIVFFYLLNFFLGGGGMGEMSLHLPDETPS